MTPRLHAFTTLLGLLGTAGRRKLGLAAASHLAERLAFSAGAVAVTVSRREAGVAALCGVGAVMLLHRLASAMLRVHAMEAVVSGVTGALLADLDGMADGVGAEAEVALLEGTHAAERVLGQRLPELLGDVPACIVLAIVVALREAPMAVAQGGAAIAAGAMAVLLLRNVVARHADRVWQALLPAFDHLLSAIHGRLEVVGNGGDARLLDALARQLTEWRARSRAAGVVTFLGGRAPALAAAGAAGVLLLWQGGWDSTSLSSAALLVSTVPSFAGLARGSLDLSRDLVRTQPVVRCLEAARGCRHTGDAEASLPADVVWSGVSFSYADQAKPSLEGVNATWRPGELLAVAGANGSGKSTLVRLLLGLHAPTQGVVTLGGTPLCEVDGRSLRRQIAYLVQRPFLPDLATVGSALALLAPEATPAAVEAMLRRLGLWPVLARRSPEKPLAVTLGTLSAGEKQRVAIARVLLRDTPALVLDEPDANLDAEGASLVGKILRETAATRMVLFIAHSETLLSCADRVLRLEAGRVVSGAVTKVA